MRAVLFLVLLTLAGCGGNHYVRPGGTNEAFQRDAARCRMAMNGLAQYQSPRGPQVYQAQSTTVAGITTGSATPSGGTSMANGLADGSDALFGIAQRERTYEDCLRAEGWERRN